MLEALRNFTKSWIMRGILLMLAATFVLFFGTDFGGGGGGGHQPGAASVVEVGDANFTIHQVSREFNEQIQRTVLRTGRPLDTRTAIEIGLLDQAIDRLVSRALFDQAAQQLGVTTSVDAAAQAIRGLPQFQNPDGRFDRSLFEQFLSHSGQSEENFISQIRLDMLRTQYVDTIRSAIAAPAPLTDAMFRHRGERRIAEIAVLPLEPDKPVGDPDAAQLTSFYETDRGMFETPEFREANLAMLDAETLAAETVIPEEELREEYEARGDEFMVHETRGLSHAVFASRDEAMRADALIDGGKPFPEAAEEVSGQAPIDLGTVSRADVPVPELADAAFDLADGALSDPVESSLGWHLVRVSGITPGRRIPFEEARSGLRDELALEEARDAIFDVLNDVEDALAGGASIEEVARDNSLRTVRVDGVARDGALRSEQPEIADAVTPEIVERLFEIDEAGIAETLETRAGGFVVVQLDGIAEPRIPDLDEIRDEVAAAWRERRISESAEESAREIADKVRGGASLESLAGEAGARFERTPAFDRTGDGANVSAELVAPVFEAERGEVIAQLISGGAAVAKLVDIEPADLSHPAREELSGVLTGQIANDLVSQLSVALRDEIGVDIDRFTLEDALQPQ